MCVENERMPLVNCFCILAKCPDDAEQLKYTDKYVRRYMALKMQEDHFSAEHATLEQWNNVLKAFAAPEKDTRENAWASLMNLLMA